MNDVILYKDKDGNIQRAISFENITREDLQAAVDEASAELQRWTNALAEYDKLSGTYTENPASDDGHISFKDVELKLPKEVEPASAPPPVI